MQTYSICLVGLGQRQAVVIGGGQIALRKAEALLDAGGSVLVISPEFNAEFDRLAQAQPGLACIQRPYQPGDLAGAWVVISATDDPQVNQAVYAEAVQRGCLVNVVDDPEHSNFILPALIRRGPVALAISTGGASPALARRLRERLEAWLSPAYGELAALLETLRPVLKQRYAPGEARLQAALRLVDSDLLEVIERCGPEEAQRRAQAMLEAGAPPGGAPQSGASSNAPAARAATNHELAPALDRSTNDADRRAALLIEQAQALEDAPLGFVSLIGAGPGDPGLLTLRGAEALQQADVVVFDRLANPSLLALCRPDVELIDVGKQPDHHPVPQARINQILVEQARLGKRVARLKGGDPFVFGRGGEEALALAAVHAPFEVVPGVTSAIAVPAYAGIPVTQRGLAGSFAVITGHRSQDGPDGLEAAADTRVFLMGVQNLPVIVQRLLEQGVPADTPAAVIANGTTPQQQVVSGALGDIACLARDVASPAITVVGPAAALRAQLQWYDDVRVRPLFGLRILHTRPEQAPRRDDFETTLQRLGAQVLDLPTTRLAPPLDAAPLQAAVESLAHHAFDWLFFSSAHAVAAFFEQLEQFADVRLLGGVRLGVVGPVTAEALAAYHLRPDFVPSQFTGLDWVNEVGDLRGQRILIPRSDIAPPELIEAMQARGAVVQAVTAYRTVPAQAAAHRLQPLWDGQVDVITLFSPSGLDGLVHMLAEARGENEALEALRSCALACIGPTTAQAARKRGLRVDMIAEPHTGQGLAQAVVQWRKRL